MNQNHFDTCIASPKSTRYRDARKYFVISGETFETKIDFNKKHFHHDNTGLEFIDCVFKEELHVSDLNKATNILRFESCTFHLLEIENTELLGLEIASSKLDVLNCKKSSIKNIFCGLENTETFLEAQKSLGFETMFSFNAKLNDLGEIKRQIAWLPSINFIELAYSEIILSGTNSPTFHRLNILAFNKPLPSITVRHMRFKEVEISGVNVSSRMSFEHLDIHALTLNSFSNLAFFSIVNAKPILELSVSKSYKATISTRDSNLGSGHFLGCDFKLYKILSFVNTHLSQCSFSNNNWAKTDRQFLLIKISGHKDQALRGVFNQLKYAHNKEGDVVTEKMFYRFEMNRLLATQNPIQNFSTWLVLGLSKWTSQYGQSLWRPPLFLGIVGFLVFWYYVSQGYHSDLIDDKNKSIFDFDHLYVIGQFIQWCNPLRKFEEQTLFGAIALDVLIRIIATYSIYNFVRATRRFIG